MRFDVPEARAPLQRRVRAALLTVPIFLAAPGYAVAGTASGGDHPGWEKSGDVLQFGIPLLALGFSFFSDSDSGGTGFNAGRFDRSGASAPGLNWPGPRLDHSPQRDFLVSFVRMEVLTYGLKYSLNTRRPNGGSQSFPSGHSSAAFMGAEFIRKQHGNWWGAPAYVAASWVGYTRVESHNHYWYDVLGGALVGIASNYDFDDIDTPLGQLSFGPAAFSSDPGAWFNRSESETTPSTYLAPPIPGLRFELRF